MQPTRHGNIVGDQGFRMLGLTLRPLSIACHTRHHRCLSVLNDISAATILHLRTHGYAFQDNVLPSSNAEALLGEMNFLIRDQYVSPNKTEIVSSSRVTSFSKASVLQAEIHLLPDQVQRQVPSLMSLQHDPSLCAFLSVHWPRLTLRAQSLKVQRSAGDLACFPIHIDAAAGRDRRIVTALLYPHRSWSSQCGALRIYDSPISFVDISPEPGRLVLLSSTLMHHRVLPTDINRFAITLWLSGTLRTRAWEMPTLESLPTRLACLMLKPEFRDITFRIALEQEWKSSIREAHPAAEADELIRNFRDNLEIIRERLPRILCKKLGLNSSGLPRVQKLLATSSALRQAYHQLEEKYDSVPFFW